MTSIEGAAAHVSHNLPIPEQVAQLVRWAESPNGPKLATVEEAFKEVPKPLADPSLLSGTRRWADP